MAPSAHELEFNISTENAIRDLHKAKIKEYKEYISEMFPGFFDEEKEFRNSSMLLVELNETPNFPGFPRIICHPVTLENGKQFAYGGIGFRRKFALQTIQESSGIRHEVKWYETSTQSYADKEIPVSNDITAEFAEFNKWMDDYEYFDRFSISGSDLNQFLQDTENLRWLGIQEKILEHITEGMKYASVD